MAGALPVKPDVLEETGSLLCSRGYALHTLTLTPADAPNARGLLVWHHGFGEHCDRHLAILREIAARLQFVVVTFDVHGHGRSGPHYFYARAFIRSWRHLVTDLLQVVDQVAKPAARRAGAPANVIFLAGHSMGGLTCMLAALRRPGAFRGVVASSPLVGVIIHNSWGEWMQILVLRLLALIIPAKPFLKRRSIEAGVRDSAAVAAIDADKLWYRDPIKTRSVVSCINGTLALQAGARKLQVPLYIQQGTDDKTCNVVCIRRLLPRIGSKDVTYYEVQGGLHDLLHDPETPKCLERIVTWLDARV